MNQLMNSVVRLNHSSIKTTLYWHQARRDLGGSPYHISAAREIPNQMIKETCAQTQSERMFTGGAVQTVIPSITIAPVPVKNDLCQ